MAIALIDSSTPITEQDQRVISMVIDSGRALVIALNKADLVDRDRRAEVEDEVLRDWPGWLGPADQHLRAVRAGRAPVGAGDDPGAGVVGPAESRPGG